ncbi:hypothetical protein BGL_1c17760 [Burkholderia plantarii]|uniref:Uncharacterized protein n=1 Tax=Burkholderia plantarii TaxID=41899 RepID=A0A0B6RYZ1_BURPL|nr:hypothetical protein BGL_1c17760 [Burkholderia plantarii]
MDVVVRVREAVDPSHAASQAAFDINVVFISGSTASPDPFTLIRMAKRHEREVSILQD